MSSMVGGEPGGRVYVHEDVFVRAHQVANYQENQGTWWSFSPDLRYDLVGIFAQLRPAGRWPRAVNLWEADWRRLTGALHEQFGEVGGTARDQAHNDWFAESAGQRAGGWDRLMLPGPGSPALAELQRGEPRPCVVQQRVRLALGAQHDYLAWFGEVAAPAVEATRAWRPLMWLGALHGSTAVTYFGAPRWDALDELAACLPAPEPGWAACVETSLLSAWTGSGLLQRPSGPVPRGL